MFNDLEMAPADPIFGLADAFRKDTNPSKINLTTGIYADSTGNTPIFTAVKKAEERILAEETTKRYLAIEGTSDFSAAVQALIFGADHEIVVSGRAVTAHTPGGTGGLRVAADLLKQLQPDATVWLSEPTWPNHPGIFAAAGLAVKTYPYYEAETKSLDFEAMCDALSQVPAGDVVLFHGCCHNPTGMDPSPEQWETVAGIARDRQFVPFLDFAYQGLGNGLEEDAQGLRKFCWDGCELIVSSSFSKNFGLYRERTGALTLVATGGDAASAALSHLKKAIRTNYSNPPSHGAQIVTTVLGDPKLRDEWETELRGMCDRISAMRGLFVKTLKQKGVTRDFSFLVSQNGMFSFSGLTPEQVDELREKHSIYMVRSGRINVAGMSESNMDTLCEAIAAVIQSD